MVSCACIPLENLEPCVGCLNTTKILQITEQLELREYEPTTPLPLSSEQVQQGGETDV